ncbi:hypothetical protein M2426_000753 [Pseudomonas moraviensis]|uniref:hypothetical protein n=1 Tax=Pseudomonas moraviensis TaxID=321662 RepID=UPI003D1EF75C
MIGDELKYCVFCGNKPEGKNKEHVIPHWLIKKTGNPNRKIELSTDMVLAQGKNRSYAFDQFTFPACEKCNTDFSALELKAKGVLEKIELSSFVSAIELSSFLDWLDKVRVGIWLGFNQLDRKTFDVQPKFHIASRVGQYDRMLIVQKSDAKNKRINMIGVNTLSFYSTPSAFGFAVNDLYFTNVSYNHLLARRCGFPYPINQQWDPERRGISCDIVEGLGRIMTPIVRKGIPAGSKVFYQPMFGRKLGTVNEKFDTPYVRSHSMDFEKGVGAIFESTSDGVKTYLGADALRVTPEYIHNEWRLSPEATIEVYEWQNWLHTLQPGLDLLSKEDRQGWKKGVAFVKKKNNEWINQTKSLLERRKKGN